MTFGNDPAVLRVAAGLGWEARLARAFVAKLVSVPAAALPWIDADDIAHTTRESAPGLELAAALLRARVIVEVEGEGSGFTLASEGVRLAALLREERAAAAERKMRQRDAAAAGTFRDQRGGTLRDIGGTTCDFAGTLRSGDEGFSGPERDIDGLASPITRAPGARGNSSSPSSPPTPPSTPASSGSASPASSSSAAIPGDTGAITDPAEAHRIATSLRRALVRVITAPPALADDIADDLLSGRVTAEELMAAAKLAPRHGGRNYNFLLSIVESAREKAEEASRAPPVFPLPNDPIRIEDARLIREHRESEGDYE